MVGGGQGAFIGEVHRLVAHMDGHVELVAGCFSRDSANTQKTGKQLYLSPERCYSSYSEMAKKEAVRDKNDRIDFVAVVTPNSSHFDIAKTFLTHGFHVVCDKPMTVTVDEAKKLAKLVEKSGLIFALTHNYTGYPLVRHARGLFRKGKMGSIRKVIVEYLQDCLMLPLEKQGNKQISWRVDPKRAGAGGTIGDVGSHAENLLEYICGEEIDSLCADFSTFLPGRKLDEDGNILIRLKGGGKGIITVSQVATGEENALRIKIYASKGAVVWCQENPNEMQIYYPQQPRQTVTRAHGEYLSKKATQVTRIPSGHPEGYLEAFANVYGDIIHAIRRHIDKKPLKAQNYEFPTVYDGLRGMRFIHKAVESAHNGSKWTKM